jgi:hypothetical protein
MKAQFILWEKIPYAAPGPNFQIAPIEASQPEQPATKRRAFPEISVKMQKHVK